VEGPQWLLRALHVGTRIGSGTSLTTKAAPRNSAAAAATPTQHLQHGPVAPAAASVLASGTGTYADTTPGTMGASFAIRVGSEGPEPAPRSHGEASSLFSA